MSQQAKHLYEFGPFRVDATERLLLRDGLPVPLTNKAFDTLLVLLESAGSIVRKDDLMRTVWTNTVVEESTLAQNVFRLRRALGEESGEQQYIETIPKHGYRFVAAVSQLPSDNSALRLEKRVQSRVISDGVSDGELVSNPDDQCGSQESLNHGTKDTHRARWLSRPRLFAGFALLATVVALFYLGISEKSSSKAPTALRSVAVLPFKYVDQEESDRYIELGMADALITRLSKIRQIIVRPASAITKYDGPEQDLRAAGKELGVDVALGGDIHKSGEQARVNVQLINVGDGSTLWAGTFVSQWNDIYGAQDLISEQIIRILSLRLTGEDQARLGKRFTQSVEAYQAYMKGRFWWNKRTEEGFRRATEFFNEAIALDRNYALAYAGLADCYAIMSPYGITLPKETYPKAKAAATQALAIDNQLAEAHASLANIIWLYEWDFPAAEAEFKQAIDLEPNYPTAHQWYSVYLSSMARHEEAIREATRARDLDPLSLAIIQDQSRAYYHARRYDDAIAASLKAFELNPQYYRLNSWLELAYAQKGLRDQAIEFRFKAMSLMGTDPKVLALLKEAYASSGWSGYWRKELELALTASQRTSVFPYNTARICARLGENDKAFRWLEEAYKERLDHLVLLKVDPVFDPLRSDPRFTDLLRRVRLEQ